MCICEDGWMISGFSFMCVVDCDECLEFGFCCLVDFSVLCINLLGLFICG